MAESRVLLVEGTDDLHVLAHIFKAHGLEGKITIRDQEGVSKLKKKLDEDFFEHLLEELTGADLSAELKGSEVVALGIVVDADFDLKARWESLANRLRDLSYKVPNGPEVNGTILRENENDLPPVGIWLMPDNTLPGMLEDFIKLLVPDEQEKLWQRAVKAVDSIPKKERKFISKDSNKTAKAQIHTYLAWQERPGVPYGIAIREKFLTTSSPHTNNLINWIKALFEL